MTNDRAIKIIETEGWGYADSEISEAMDKMREAFRFRTPRQPELVRGTSLFGEASCPECGAVVYRTEDFCSHCGQMLDWPEYEPEVKHARRDQETTE